MLFPDIPWLLADEGDQPLSLTRFKQLMDIERSSSLRLMAMGIDSYQLLGHLARLQSSENEALDGKTGQLYMDRLNNIHRQLVWAQMKNSVPSVIGYAPRLASDFGEPEKPQSLLPFLQPATGEAEDAAPVRELQ